VREIDTLHTAACIQLVLNVGGAYAKPVTRMSFHQARQRFLGLIRQNSPQQQQQFAADQTADDDVDMLVPDGMLAFFYYLKHLFILLFSGNSF